jgi:DNA repair exonuclease SbcCD nuclease subunit
MNSPRLYERHKKARFVYKGFDPIRVHHVYPQLYSGEINKSLEPHSFADLKAFLSFT